MVEKIRIPGNENGKRKSVLEYSRESGLQINADCAGNGRCGKCKVLLVEGELIITEQDRLYLSEQELSFGVRLACCAYPTTEVVVIPVTEEQASILTDENIYHNQNVNTREGTRKDCSCIIDLGTTTVVMVLYDSTGARLGSRAFLNPQKIYGADVISRIQAAVEGKGQELKRLICDRMAEELQSLRAECGVINQPLTRILLAGNTTMIHLLRGFSCDTLGVYPFTPVDISLMKLPAKDIFGIAAGEAELTILPAISTFVGGDIVAGLYAQGFEEAEENRFLVDLGTNGEMAVGNRKRILVTSVAAGPAFEGGNISCGVGSVSGAVSDITLEGSRITSLQTIFEQPPLGICGSGVLALVGEMVNNELIDGSGKLCEPYFKTGFPFARDVNGREMFLTQKDIREIQMAKSAIYAGIEVLRQRIGETDRLDLFLSGGFSSGINLKKLEPLDMFPKGLRIHMAGNSCLAGLKKCLFSANMEKSLEQIVRISEEVTLATDMEFCNLFMESMGFKHM